MTSLTPAIARTLEPRAPAPRKRLAAVKALREAGVPALVSIAPVVPAITDHELEHIVEAAAEAGALGCFYLPVRLPYEVAPLFRAWLDEHFPDRAGKVMAIIQSLRGGRDNDPNFFSRMRGQGPWADLAQDPLRAGDPQARPEPRAPPAAHRPVPPARRRADAAVLAIRGSRASAPGRAGSRAGRCRIDRGLHPAIGFGRAAQLAHHAAERDDRVDHRAAAGLGDAAGAAAAGARRRRVEIRAERPVEIAQLAADPRRNCACRRGCRDQAAPPPAPAESCTRCRPTSRAGSVAIRSARSPVEPASRGVACASAVPPAERKQTKRQPI